MQIVVRIAIFGNRKTASVGMGMSILLAKYKVSEGDVPVTSGAGGGGVVHTMSERPSLGSRYILKQEGNYTDRFG